MDHRRISELMTHHVVSVRPDTSFKEIARTLADSAVSAVPVLDSASRPSGVVSEADLLRRAAMHSDLSGRTPLPDFDAWEQAEAEGSTAEEVMSAPPLCAHPEWTVVEAARFMASHNVKRLPVVDEADRLLGIISRSDLLRVFLRRDEAIREEITHEVLGKTLGLAPNAVTVQVDEGRVTLRGTLDDRRLIPILTRMCNSVDGVISVSEDLAHRTNDAGTPIGAGNGTAN